MGAEHTFHVIGKIAQEAAECLPSDMQGDVDSVELIAGPAQDGVIIYEEDI